MDIGNKIKQLRTRQGLTLEELASRSELTKLKPGGFLSAKCVENPIYSTCCVR